ncbi:MAG TPA: penicillin-binding transpeptidase domain-containing protein [Acidimicrobiia bacterium]|nr:penicillin-binding transpeptidase domain-containing protein [Acidimicrobiia bacterium]
MKFALRLTTLGIVFTAMLTVIGLRLWFVQVAEGPQTAQEAEELAWLEKTSYGPRGDIFDRNGTLLATSRLAPAVYVDRTFVQPEDRDSLIQALASIAGFDPIELGRLYDEAGINGRFQVDTVPNATAYVINENLDHLPGVEIVMVPERVYLSGPTLAHVIGHLGLPDANDKAARPDIDLSLRIGKLGVERVYDEYLQGVTGLVEYQVQRGQIVAQRPPIEPEPGNSVVLNIDLELQELTELALEEGVALSNTVKDEARANGNDVFSETQRAAAVVLDAKTFEVLALASFPDFDPTDFVTGIDARTFEGLTDINAFNNLAISGLYPPSSTFKAVTYTVKLEENLPLAEDLEGVDVANQTVHCDGTLILSELEDGSQPPKTDWYAPRDLGWLDIHGALAQSCNIYFWSVAMGTWRAYKDTPQENIIQDWAKSLGFGSATGIDLTAEADGTVPTRELFEEWAAYQLENPDQPPLLEPNRLELASPWLGGDLVDMAIGQGAFTATPLQVAVSYAALVNGGTIMEPRVVREVVDADGNVVFEPESRLVGTVDIDPATRASLLTDLNRVVTGGTAARAFLDFGPGLDNIGGKTGTGQTSKNRDNHAWFVGVAPIDDPKYIVVILIDEGGSGGRVAAPVGRHIMQYLMGNEPTPIVEGDPAD